LRSRRSFLSCKVKRQRNPQNDFSAITKQVQDWLDRGYYPGAAVLIAKENQVIYERCIGAYTPDTVVFIASSGKWLAAATIMSLVDEGKLSLDDPASKWIPQLKGERGRSTLRQMLSHTSGYEPYQPDDKPKDDYQTLEESVAHIVPLPMAHRPGEQFEYGGLAMRSAGRMAEVAAGKSWEQLFQERNCPFVADEQHFIPVDSGGGHSPMVGGGARSTLRDYTNFLSMIFNDGSFQGRRVLSKNAIREMEADQVHGATVPRGNFVEEVRGQTRNDIYGLGAWRELVKSRGSAVLLSSPSRAGAYPWIDKSRGIYGVILAHVNVEKANEDHFRVSFKVRCSQ
jgi:CubicO group peptidase (beta-lactamase class C family)